MPNPRSRWRRLILPVLVALALPASGNAIQWNSALLGTSDADSTGTALDASWSFYLGAFTDPTTPNGWAPTSGNTAEWDQYWVTADVAGYFPPMPPFPTAGRYSSTHNVTGIIPPFFQGQATRGYIWGTNRACPDGEWILMTDPNWIWPASAPLDPTTLTWSIEASTTTIVGTVNQGGFQMQTAVVSSGLPPFLTGENWREIHFTSDEIENQEATVSGWDADPNGNGRPNILEFAYNADPVAFGRTNEPVLGTLELTGNIYLTLTVSKDPNVDLIYTGEVGANLAMWFDDAANVVLQSETAKELVYRDLTALGSGPPAHAMRVRVTLP